MIKFCPTCGKALALCFCLAVGGVPAIEAYSPPEEHCTAAPLAGVGSVARVWADTAVGDPLCAERPIATKPDDAPENDYGTTNQPTIELAETGGAAMAPFGWSDAANSLPVGHRYRRRNAAVYQPDNGWMGYIAIRNAAG